MLSTYLTTADTVKCILDEQEQQKSIKVDIFYSLLLKFKLHV